MMLKISFVHVAYFPTDEYVELDIIIMISQSIGLVWVYAVLVLSVIMNSFY